MPGTRQEPAKVTPKAESAEPEKKKVPSKGIAWSDLYLGGESEVLQSGRKLVHSRKIIERGEEVSKSEAGVSDAEWEEFFANGSVREYPFPEGYDKHPGMSPVTFIIEQQKAKMEAAEMDPDAETVEDILVRASVAGTQIVGPNPEDILLGEGVEEVK